MVLWFLSSSICQGQHSYYPFIRYNSNRLVLPVDTSGWVHFKRKATEVRNRTTNSLVVLHLGDSHIQGDYFTGEVRKLFFNYLHVEDCSHGIWFPYTLVGSNGPDEILVSGKGIKGSSILHPVLPYYAITGYTMGGNNLKAHIHLKDTSAMRFSKFSIYHNGGASFSCDGFSKDSEIKLTDELYVSSWHSARSTSELSLDIGSEGGKETLIYGFSLDNTQNHISYHNIGINGATFNTFNQLKGIRETLRFLKPDCIVLSYGTNDAMDTRLDSSRLEKQIIRMIDTLRGACPGIPLIFTLPGDHLIGKKYPNGRLPFVCSTIKRICREQNCIYWDFYSIMGGKGAMRYWYAEDLAFRDLLHLSKEGYKLQGDLFFDALVKALEH